MTLDDIQAKLEAGIENSVVTMQGDGCNCATLVVSPIFEGVSLLARQKMILAVVRENIDSGELHALTIKARTPTENASWVYGCQPNITKSSHGLWEKL